MNVCMITYSFYEIDFRVRRYAEVLVNAGYDVDVFALKRKGQNRRENLNGVNINHLQERDYNEKGLISFLIRMILFFGRVFLVISARQFHHPYKVVHVHNPPDFLVFTALVPKILGAKIIFDMHENLPEFYCAKFNRTPDTFLVRVLLFFEKIGTRFADFTIAAHDLLRERIITRDGIPERACLALLNYPTKTFFDSHRQKNDKEEFRIIYPGTISYQNGIDIAIKAMAIVKQECKSAKLDIYGSSRDPTYYRGLIKLIDELDLNGTVSFFDTVPFEKMQELLLEASAGIVPKRGGIFGSEAFSTKILEFMAAGIPAVISRTRIDEYYFDNTLVMFFEPDDHADLAKCILELCRSSEKRQGLAKKGTEFIEKNNWEIKGQLYLDAVSKLVG
jgi:glycosyltransferase involved in cell wall biosynthesis